LLIAGTASAFLSGLAAIALLLRMMRTRGLLVFVVYRVALGVALLVLVAAGRLAP
jgi:undecaprenyl-diphosphatase